MVRLRKAREKDLKDIDRIYVEGSIDEGRLQFPKIAIKEMDKDLKKFKKDRIGGWKKGLKSKNNYWIVLEDSNSIVGFGNAEIKKNYDYKEGTITMVYIDRKFRKKGLGRMVIKRLILWLKGKKVKYIEAGFYSNNKPSIKLFKKLGFNPISLKMRIK